MAKNYWFEIPCPHESNPNKSHDRILSDYHPLKKAEVAKILDFMLEHKHDIVMWAKGAVRLSQGIKGMTCPYPAEGKIAQKHVKLERLLADIYTLGGMKEMVESVMKLQK